MKTTALALVLLGGCLYSQSGDDRPPSDPPPSQPTARQLFETSVYPVLEVKCAGCHGAEIDPAMSFVPATADAAYDRITTDSALVGDFHADRAPITLKTQGSHQGVRFTADESAKLVQWLDAELAERN